MSRNETITTAAHWGPLSVSIENKKITQSTSALPQTIENQLQKVVADQVYSNARIKYPFVRKGYLENPDAPTPMRGGDTFVQVTWEEAYDLIEKELKHSYKNSGPESIFAGSYGWQSSGALHRARTLLHRFLKLTGGFTNTTGDYSAGAVKVIMSHVLGSSEVYEPQTSWKMILKHTEVVVLWGMNPLNTLKVAWSASDGEGLAYFSKLRASGKKIICINPVHNETVSFFGQDATWIAPKPNTDVAMMLGIAHTLVLNKQHDTKFLEKYTSGYEIFEQYLLGHSEDQIEKTSAWASNICGISKDQIEALAHLFSKNRTILMAGWGLQRQHHGEQPHWMLVTLASMLGQIGQKGSGFGFSYHYGNGGVPASKGPLLMGMKVTSNPKESSNCLTDRSKYNFPVARIADALQNPGKKLQINGSEITYPDIKVIWWCGGNPLTQHQDTNQLRLAWQKPRMVVVQDPYWTATAKHADIVLPISTSFERNDLTMTGDHSDMHIVPMKQIIEPQFDSKSDFQVFSELSKRFNILDKFTEGKDEMEWLKSFYEEAVELSQAQEIEYPSFELFWSNNKLIKNRSDIESEAFIRYCHFYNDPIKHPLKTPSGKIEIYSKVIEKMGYDDCPPHPTWLEPLEYLGNATEDAPFHMISEHPPYRLHSQLNQTSLRHLYSVTDREPIQINPNDAKRKNINNGDLVRVFNKRGQILAGALLTDKVREGVVVIHEGAWYDPIDSSQNELDKNLLCKNGAVNLLTLDIGSSKLSQACVAQTALVNIEKYMSEDPKVTAFDPPEIS